MGKHGKPGRPDRNVFGSVFRDFEPGHSGLGDPDPVPEHTVPPIERTDGSDLIPVITDSTPDPRLSETSIIFDREWPEAYEDEHPETRRSRWPVALGLSVAFCALVTFAWFGTTSDDSTPARMALRPVQAPTPVVVTVTARPAVPTALPVVRPTVTKWRTRTPAPVIRVERSPVPGPTVRATRTVTAKPSVSVSVSRVPVPGPTCRVRIVLDVTGDEIERSESGSCL